ncbi:MAG: carboxypeptidase-like regulatory domain-containing protein [bacterium]
MSDTYYDDRSRLVRNRWRIGVVLAIAVAIFAWKIYVAANDDGYIRGVVVDAAGHPVAGARVELQEKTINLVKQPIVEETNADGRFEYEEIQMIEFFIAARKGDLRSEGGRHHLYFKGQNYTLDEPLVLQSAGQ